MISNNTKLYLKTYKAEIIKYTIICVLTLLCVLSINKCSKYKYLNDTNITALTDTIKYYKSKSGNLVVEKTILSGDINLLKQVNDSLYNIIKDIKVKNPDNIVYINTTIKDIIRDTCWVVKRDSIIYNNSYIKKDFSFSDNWRTVQGYTYLKYDTLGTVISKNDVRADFTVVQKDNKVYITSNNPYIEYNNIIGITNSNNIQQKQKRFGIGPYIGFGITHKLDFVPTIGVSLHWSMIQF